MNIPKEVKSIINKLKKGGFEAYVVGGCVRDLLQQNKEPNDWDITTNAKPEEIQKIFPNSFYENKFLTVTVQIESQEINLKKLKEDKSSFCPFTNVRELKEDKHSFNPFVNIREIEITTYRSEAKYTNKRHPDEIRFAKTLEEDLARRDFTMNAMAIDLLGGNKQQTFKIIDFFKGQDDLKNRIIRAVGNPEQRFNEDALRMLRAVRLATILDFTIEEKTYQAIKKNSDQLKMISQERIKDELIKIIMNKRASYGIELLRNLNLLKYIIPEIEEGCGVAQNKHHIYECYEHNLRALDYAAKTNFNKYVRLAAFFHDIGKPRTKQGEGKDSTFYNHEVVGAKMTNVILSRLKFSKKDVEKITKLVRYHLFYYNVDEVSDSSVRRLVRQVGLENMEELLQLRMADRIGSGVAKAEPYKLRHLKYIIEKVSRDPISVKMLKISGNDIMNILKISSGPKVGQILDILLSYVLDNPKKNKKLGEISEEKLKILGQKAKKEREKLEIKEDEMTKQKYWVS